MTDKQQPRAVPECPRKQNEKDYLLRYGWMYTGPPPHRWVDPVDKQVYSRAEAVKAQQQRKPIREYDKGNLPNDSDAESPAPPVSACPRCGQPPTRELITANCVRFSCSRCPTVPASEGSTFEEVAQQWNDLGWRWDSHVDETNARVHPVDDARVKRYSLDEGYVETKGTSYPEMREDEQGEYVRFEDYKQLHSQLSSSESALREALKSIIIRCKEGDCDTDWLPIIADIAQRALDHPVVSSSERRSLKDGGAEAIREHSKHVGAFLSEMAEIYSLDVELGDEINVADVCAALLRVGRETREKLEATAPTESSERRCGECEHAQGTYFTGLCATEGCDCKCVFPAPGM